MSRRTLLSTSSRGGLITWRHTRSQHERLTTLPFPSPVVPISALEPDGIVPIESLEPEGVVPIQSLSPAPVVLMGALATVLKVALA
jgi:hypothetical protein